MSPTLQSTTVNSQVVLVVVSLQMWEVISAELSGYPVCLGEEDRVVPAPWGTNDAMVIRQLGGNNVHMYTSRPRVGRYGEVPLVSRWHVGYGLFVALRSIRYSE